jgi:hypothetical protein
VGRHKEITDSVQLHVYITRALDKRLEYYATEFGWTRRQIVEYALAGWFGARDTEVKDGLAEIK